MLDELSIFLLAYNEEKNIEKCVKSAIDNARKYAKKSEVIVVLYEGSSDGTKKIVENLSKKNKTVRLVIQHKKDKGYGAALKIGIFNSKFKHIFYTDADNQLDINEINRLVPYVGKYDIVTGVRHQRKDQFMRILAAKVYNILLNIIFGTHFRDVDCAFKIYKKKIFDEIKVNCKTGMADAEIMVKAKRKKYKIKELPVSHYVRKHGEAVFQGNDWGLIKPKVVIDLLKDMKKLWRELH